MFDRGRIRRLAARYAERDKLQEALREYGRIVELDARDISALHEIARVESRLGSREAVARTFAQIGERLVARGWKLAASYRYRQLLELIEPLGPEARARYRSIPDRIARLRAEVAEQRPTLADYDEAALALEQNRRDPEVADLLGKMTTLEPDNPVFHARLAETCCRLGKIDEALPEFRLAARALLEFGRTTDALRVLERILHLRSDPDDSLFAAKLYLERGDADDPKRAVAKLQPCIAADPERLEALALLARAFDVMGQSARSLQVRIEMARIAKEAGEKELSQDLLSTLVKAVPEDPRVRALNGRARSLGSSGPELSIRSSFVSVTNEELASLQDVLEETRSQSDGSVLDDLSFEELSEVWVMPVVSKEARRAMDDADAFLALRLFPKAEYVLRGAIESDPVCAELREALRGVLRSSGDSAGFVEETVALADLYRQRRFPGRAWTLVDEALALDPENDEALAFAAALGPRNLE